MVCQHELLEQSGFAGIHQEIENSVEYETKDAG